MQALKAAAPGLLLELKVVPVRMPEEFDAAFLAATRTNAQTLYAHSKSTAEGFIRN